MLHVKVNTPTLSLLSALLSLLMVQLTVAQITIAPTTLFMTEKSNVSNFLVINNSNEAQEVSVNFFFGYVKTDDKGNRQIVNEDDELAADYSLADWLRGFPRIFTLQPGERQTVRIRANPPAGLEDRTYWSRIRTSSNPVSPSVEEQQENAVTARINVKIDQVTGIYLKKGKISTGIEVNNIEVSQNDGQLTALVDIDRTGNSPFIGTVTSTVTAEGKELANQQSTTTIFVDGVHRFSFDVSDMEPGKYQFNIQFETSRRDIRDEELVQGETATAAKEFMLSE